MEGKHSLLRGKLFPIWREYFPSQQGKVSRPLEAGGTNVRVLTSHGLQSHDRYQPKRIPTNPITYQI